ncbi:MAG: hypothetical protein MPEBLZ_02345 [Candidatus Methanoperedens nitroreducens]|uniref:Uncharacterized protein n=1 Tax=Candidatus Methanoperedens nitratireducens TaxID=1392998 RepID=A0A0P8C8I1_9EURY|nr:hypothetical protein [Candidatus Methanoperedens sp. BLZ2]KAB2947326.1 MAG: hypothetical protein F9K14_04525 [Candidatus Methanoperedens sp.]KPQ43121.1 MAG: hypothetical protein MPEBLZ_02345 [Candidatus Methanoperedens sp. BLZ1]MBZ0175531.1 hypothetical protein [Candidatus Methanoperedens nitroreducens]CAG1002640.1 hypothetical protein METP1_03016 [Methanosarcinales archaeon]MCX9080263.1 hypothetical protein [Candidatus Methanoperedens sp.]
MKLRAEPFTLEWRPDNKESERNLRNNLNLEWCDAVLFNVNAIKKGTGKEYDAILLSENKEAILFFEYKDSPTTYRNYKGKKAQQKNSYAKNIAKAFGFRWYNFIVVVNKKGQSNSKKGDSRVILMDELKNYVLHKEDEKVVFSNEEYEIELLQTNDVLNSIDKVINRYKNEKGSVESNEVFEDLVKVKRQIEQVNK